jgi:CheY-like chemotaxis protein
MKDNPHQILLVEDDPADIFLAQELFDEHGGFCIQVVNTGTDALAYLRREGQFAGVTRPDMVLLDLNIPGLDGRDVLRAIKTADDLRTLPVIVMSTSDAPDDIQTSYRLGANCFITKPVGIDGFQELVRQLDLFWFRFVRLPTR